MTHTRGDAISFKELLPEEWPMGFSVGHLKKYCLLIQQSPSFSGRGHPQTVDLGGKKT